MSSQWPRTVLNCNQQQRVFVTVCVNSERPVTRDDLNNCFLFIKGEDTMAYKMRKHASNGSPCKHMTPSCLTVFISKTTLAITRASIITVCVRKTLSHKLLDEWQGIIIQHNLITYNKYTVSCQLITRRSRYTAVSGSSLDTAAHLRHVSSHYSLLVQLTFDNIPHGHTDTNQNSLDTQTPNKICDPASRTKNNGVHNVNYQPIHIGVTRITLT